MSSSRDILRVALGRPLRRRAREAITPPISLQLITTLSRLFFRNRSAFRVWFFPESPVKTSVREPDLPVIDLSSARDDLVRSIVDSAADFGCFQVINHGVSCDVTERAEKECGGLFELSLEKKQVMSRSLEPPFIFEDGVCDNGTSTRQESFWLEKEANQIEDFVINIWRRGMRQLQLGLKLSLWISTYLHLLMNDEHFIF